LTLGENIADLGGLNVAYDALQVALKKNPAEAHRKIDGYTEDQRFFIAFAVPETSCPKRRKSVEHRPARAGAISRDRRTVEHARVRQAFARQAGDAMVRDAAVRVKIW
jgi:putative endopeptidase